MDHEGDASERSDRRSGDPSYPERTLTLRRRSHPPRAAPTGPRAAQGSGLALPHRVAERGSRRRARAGETPSGPDPAAPSFHVGPDPSQRQQVSRPPPGWSPPNRSPCGHPTQSRWSATRRPSPRGAPIQTAHPGRHAHKQCADRYTSAGDQKLPFFDTSTRAERPATCPSAARTLRTNSSPLRVCTVRTGGTG